MNIGEAMYRQIVEAVPEGIWIVDPEGRTIFSNQRMADLLGVDFASMPEQSCFACVFPEDAEDARRNFERTLAGDRRPFDFRLRRADGSPLWVAISCMPMQNIAGSPTGLLGLFSDISERKQAEDALRRSEELFRSLVNDAPVITWMSGPEKRGTYYNACALAFAGIALEEAIGQGFLQFVHPGDLDRYRAAIYDAADRRVPFSIEARFRRADGEYRWMLVTGVPRMMDGAYLGHVGTSIDVTDLKLGLEYHLANQKLESLGLLAASVAHDLNNLLAAIVAHTESAQGETGPLSAAAEDLRDIHLIALRASEIASQLMMFAREEAAPSTEIDLSRLVGEMLDLLKVSIPKTVALRTELAAGLPTVQGSASEIRQVVMNLILNASESLPKSGGAITIRTAAAAGGESGGAVRLEVRDTGCGMSDELKARIFEPFFTTRAAGRGLGLAAVRGNLAPARRFDGGGEHSGRGQPVFRDPAVPGLIGANRSGGRVWVRALRTGRAIRRG